MKKISLIFFTILLISGCLKNGTKSRNPAEQQSSKHALSNLNFESFKNAESNYTLDLKTYSDCVINGVQDNSFKKEDCEEFKIKAVMSADIMLKARNRAAGLSFGSTPVLKVRADTRALLDEEGIVSPPFYEM